jgi:hypothetical protein
MEVTFLIKVVCDVTDNKGCGLEETIRRAQEDLREVGLSGCFRYIDAYRIEDVQKLVR